MIGLLVLTALLDLALVSLGEEASDVKGYFGLKGFLVCKGLLIRVAKLKSATMGAVGRFT